MTLPDLTTIRRAMTPAAPSLDRYNELLAYGARRIERAAERMLADEAEHDAAMASQADLLRARARFIADNPDPQLAMPL